MGIGAGIEEDTLHLIAGGGPVVQVADFSQLEDMMGKIKSSACASKLTSESGNFLVFR